MWMSCSYRSLVYQRLHLPLAAALYHQTTSLVCVITANKHMQWKMYMLVHSVIFLIFFSTLLHQNTARYVHTSRRSVAYTVTRTAVTKRTCERTASVCRYCQVATQLERVWMQVREQISRHLWKQQLMSWLLYTIKCVDYGSVARCWAQ
jgi:hypothetical protein